MFVAESKCMEENESGPGSDECMKLQIKRRSSGGVKREMFSWIERNV